MFRTLLALIGLYALYKWLVAPYMNFGDLTKTYPEIKTVGAVVSTFPDGKGASSPSPAAPTAPASPASPAPTAPATEDLKAKAITVSQERSPSPQPPQQQQQQPQQQQQQQHPGIRPEEKTIASASMPQQGNKPGQRPNIPNSFDMYASDADYRWQGGNE